VIDSYKTLFPLPACPTGLRLYLDNFIDKFLSANHPTLRKLKFLIMTILSCQDNVTSQFPLHGLPEARLHIAIHGFALVKLQNRPMSTIWQALPARLQALFLLT